MLSYEISSDCLKAVVLNYGATLMSLWVPDKDGLLENVTLCFNRPKDYLNNKFSLGIIAGRYANRIGGARFMLDGHQYQLSPNEGKNILHGGPEGFGSCWWKTIFISASSVTLELVSADGDQGFPGELRVQVSYTLAGRSLFIDYAAISTKATPISLTAHPYFNLRGRGNASDIFSHELMIDADKILELDETKIPTGKTIPVDGTFLDFKTARPIGGQNKYDFAYVINQRKTNKPQLAATLKENISGRTMNLYTTEPSLQFYDGHMLNGTHQPATGLCLEPQAYPDAPNHADFPSSILRPNTLWRSQSIYEFIF